MDHRIGKPLISPLIVVLVKGNDEKAVMRLRPLMIGVEIFLQPGIACRDALCRLPVVHVVIEIRND